MIRFHLLFPIGRAQAWLAQTWRASDSAWTRTWTLALWVPTRAIFCLGCRLAYPRAYAAYLEEQR